MPTMTQKLQLIPMSSCKDTKEVSSKANQKLPSMNNMKLKSWRARLRSKKERQNREKDKKNLRDRRRKR